MISPGTSPLLPSGREPPFTVTEATRGEGVGRCSAHAQCDCLEGTVFLVQCQDDCQQHGPHEGWGLMLEEIY